MLVIDRAWTAMWTFSSRRRICMRHNRTFCSSRPPGCLTPSPFTARSAAVGNREQVLMELVRCMKKLWETRGSVLSCGFHRPRSCPRSALGKSAAQIHQDVDWPAIEKGEKNQNRVHDKILRFLCFLGVKTPNASTLRKS